MSVDCGVYCFISHILGKETRPCIDPCPSVQVKLQDYSLELGCHLGDLFSITDFLLVHISPMLYVLSLPLVLYKLEQPVKYEPDTLTCCYCDAPESP